MNEAMKKSTTDYKHDGKGDGANTTPWTSTGMDGAKKRPEKIESAGSQLAVQTHDLTSQVARSAEGLVKAEVGKQTDKGAADLREVAKALRQTSKDLENNMAAPYVEKAADQIDRASKFLRTADVNDVIKTVERFANREPLLFIGGAFALGLLGARFMKSSAHGHGPAAYKPGNGTPNDFGAKRSPQTNGSGGPR